MNMFNLQSAWNHVRTQAVLNRGLDTTASDLFVDVRLWHQVPYL